MRPGFPHLGQKEFGNVLETFQGGDHPSSPSGSGTVSNLGIRMNPVISPTGGTGADVMDALAAIA